MNNLPKDDEVNITYLNEAFNSMNTSYKIFCFKAIYDEIILDNYCIDFKTLACRMIESVWYPLLKYKLNLGKQDQLQKIVNEINTKGTIKTNIESIKLLKILKQEVDDKLVDELLKYVIYRLIRPTFSKEIKNIKTDYAQQNAIMNLCENNFECIYRVDSKNRMIYVNSCWFKYIKRNQNIINGWMRYKLIEFLQKRNPNVPAIINKIDVEVTRDLKEATRLWKSIVEHIKIYDIYTGDLITAKEFEIKNLMSVDHFIPWSFIGHDMLWNLIPTFKNINSSKSDNLPEWEIYFDKFVKQQYHLFCFLRVNASKYKKILEDYLEIFNSYDINNITNKETSISYNDFYVNMLHTLQPLYQIAYNQGFTIWRLDNGIHIKQIEENKEEIMF
ncbi:HNH endonuclease [Clostridium sp. NSJ-145]|uniref:HNH endonuclease domain-containing protein n=1 Tax=Clostridium sp. NSJ-145 TaxID=2897777 RepID=UPI001E65282F|nr:HNH endonuclease domain-containing protein [Clostridium sp. NSJ-145]MCD2501101.1 HNH endonuclease [Clostridium sp. NSJ-145]